jgi:hypothetical protein
MVTVHIHAGDDLVQALGRKDASDADAYLRLMLAAKLVETGELSTGQAAQLCGLTYGDMLLALGKLGVAAIALSSSELADELRGY